jgi:hypothetical protein
MDTTDKIQSTASNGTTGQNMNTGQKFSIFNFQLSILFLLLLFSGCEKEDTDTLKADSFNGTLTAKVENGASYNSQISKVWALFDAEVNSAGELKGMMAKEGAYADGGFTVSLPAIPAQYLTGISLFFSNVLNIRDELDISEPGARMLDVDFFGISGENTYIDFFTFTNRAAKRVTCLFAYVDSDVTVKGGKNVKVMLKQGWNRIYWTPSDSKVTSSAPSGMKWYLNRDVK